MTTYAGWSLANVNFFYSTIFFFQWGTLWFWCFIVSFLRSCFCLFWRYLRIKYWLWFFRTQHKSFAKGILHVPDERVSAKLKFRPTYEPYIYESDYSVSGTDYDSFAVVFSCQETNISPWVIIYHYAIRFINQLSWFSAINYFNFAYFTPPAYNFTPIFRPIVLTRELCPTAAVIEKINKVVDKTKVFKSYFKETSPLCKVLEEKNIC